MYQAYWGFSEPPFGNSVDPHRYAPNPWQDEALARLDYLVESNCGFGLLIGPAGSGKSLLLAVLAQRLKQAGKAVATINLAGCEVRDVLAAIALPWGMGLRPGLSFSPQDTSQLWRQIGDRLVELHYEGRPGVLLLDDLDLAAPAVISALPRFMTMAPSPLARLTIIGASSSAGVAAIGDRMLDRADLRIELPLWDDDDTRQFITAQLRRAGRTMAIFQDSALTRLHELSGGSPRRVCQLVQLSLLAGAGRELTEIDASTVEAICEELTVIC